MKPRYPDIPWERVKKFAVQIGESEIIAELLLQRGVDTQEKAAEFFSSERLIDPFAFMQMEETTALILEMIEAGVPIAIYSDYDCDGVCGASILYLTLKKLGAEVRVYIPDRFTEGYGTNARAMELLADEAGLIITVDCGIRSVEDVALVRDMGVEVIVLDHHECGDILPDTPYILNPKCPGETYPNKNLCGAGIAFKVACALLGEDALRLVDLAGIATIGDLVSLTGENRVIAALGIKRLREAPNPGIRALMQEAKLDPAKIGSYVVSFVIVPRINAAGRLEHAIRAFDLITATDRAERAELARHINALNEERKVIQQNISVLAETQITQERVIVIRGEHFHKGVVGLAASRIAERYYRPTIVLSEENGMLTGSARSIDGVNIYEVMNSVAGLYTRFGGHAQAAGVTMQAEHFEAFREGVNAFAAKIDADVFRRRQYYDAVLPPAQATLDLADDLQKLEPFGMDNPSPVFLIPEAEVSNVVKLGKNKEHSKGRVDRLNCIRFGGALAEGVPYALLGTLSVNEYQGVRTLQFTVQGAQIKRPELTEQARMAFLRNFPVEVKKLAEHSDREDNTQAFATEFQDAQEETVILVGSLPGWKMLSELPEDFPVLFRDCGGGNRILVGTVPTGSYSRVYRVGAFSAKTAGKDLFCEKLIEAYRREAKEYFLTEAELADYRKAFSGIREGYDSISQLLGAACGKIEGGTLKKAWFAMNVFFERKLIALSKSDKIKIIYFAESGEPGESPLYQCFESFIKEAQYV